jgi:Tol biopolymer transport system component
MSEHDAPKPETPLDSWKEIAAYLQRDARTVRRWEQDEGLPVHRHQHRARSSVYAYPSELDAWRAARKPDGKSANQARLRPRSTRLAAAAAVGLMTLLSAGGGRFVGMGISAQATDGQRRERVVWSGDAVDSFGRVSPDGRFITYVDWATCNVMVRDLVDATDRPLTANTLSDPCAGSGGYSVTSPDGRTVAYAWDDHAARRRQIVLSRLDGVDGPHQLFALDDSDAGSLRPHDWSPDGRWLALRISRPDRTSQLGLLSLVDGRFRPLKSFTWGTTPGSVFFSRDGRFLAYDSPGAADQPADVYLLAVDGSREQKIVGHAGQDEVKGWSPDGRFLIFASDRTGSLRLWRLPMDDGRVTGAPELLTGDIGTTWPLGFTADGILFLLRTMSSRDAHVARVDVEAGRLIAAPVGFTEGFVDGTGTPVWSRDGSRLAYRSCGGNCLAIRSVATGAARVLASGLRYVWRPAWSPDGRRLVTAGTDDKGRPGIYEVDVETGAVTQVVQGDGLAARAVPQYSIDGSKILYRAGDGAVIEHDRATHREREVVRIGAATMRLSPDGRYFAIAPHPSSAQTGDAEIRLVPATGGEPRVLLTLAGSESSVVGVDTWGWTADSRALLLTTMVGDDTGLWLVPIDGGPRRRLDIDPRIWMDGSAGGVDRGFSLSPDGRHMAFLVGRQVREVWAFEGLLPRPVTR